MQVVAAFELADVPVAFGILAVIAGVIAFLWSEVRKRTREAEDADTKRKVDLNELATSRIDFLAGEVERLNQDLSRERDRGAHLSGKVEQLGAENAELRRIVLQEALPAAMQSAMETLARAITEANSRAITEYREAAKREHDALFELFRGLSDRIGDGVIVAAEIVEQAKEAAVTAVSEGATP